MAFSFYKDYQDWERYGTTEKWCYGYSNKFAQSTAIALSAF